MKVHSCWRCRCRASAISLLAFLFVLTGETRSLGAHHGNVNAGSSDGTGSLPKPTPPAQPNHGTAPSVATQSGGQVLHATTGAPAAGMTVVVTKPGGGVAGIAVTDHEGFFSVYLAQTPDQELAIPAAGIAGVPICAGDFLTVVVP